MALAQKNPRTGNKASLTGTPVTQEGSTVLKLTENIPRLTVFQQQVVDAVVEEHGEKGESLRMAITSAVSNGRPLSSFYPGKLPERGPKADTLKNYVTMYGR